MTIATTKSMITFEGDNQTKLFSFDFKVLKAEHLQVYLVEGDTETRLTEGSDYTVNNLSEESGGSITLIQPPKAGQKLSIHRILLPVQETAFKNQGPFFPQIHENAFDQVVMLIQQLINTIGDTVGTDARSLLLGLADTDGQGAYRAKGNRIANLGKPIQETDAVRVQDLKPFADAAAQSASEAEQSAQSIMGIENRTAVLANNAAQAAEDARNAALSIDTSTFYTKEEANTAIETAIETHKFDFWRDAPVGFVMDWEQESLPNEKWLRYDGSTFDPEKYPELAALGIYPDNRLPDVSDRYIRYIGNESKYQQYQLLEDTMQKVAGEFNLSTQHGVSYDAAEFPFTGPFKRGNFSVNGMFSGQLGMAHSIGFDNSIVARTSDENRPKTMMLITRIIKASS